MAMKRVVFIIALVFGLEALNAPAQIVTISTPTAAVNVFSSGSDDTASITAAIATGASTIVLPSAAYKISSTIMLASNQCIIGGNRGGTVLNWIGGNGTDLVTANLALYPCLRNMTINSGTATGVTLLHLQDTQLGSFQDIVLAANNGTGNLCLYMQAGVNGNGGTFNTVQNNFLHTRAFGCQDGFKAAGTASSPTVVTDNNFYDFDVEGSSTTAGIMFNFVQWADTNNFYYARAALGADNSTALSWNTGTPASNVGVYDNNMFYFDVDAFGSVVSQTGITCNWSKQNTVIAFYHSPDVFPGTLLNQTSNCQSFYIVDNGATQNVNSLGYTETKQNNTTKTQGQLILKAGASFPAIFNQDASSNFTIQNDLFGLIGSSGGTWGLYSNAVAILDYGITTSNVATFSPTVNLAGGIKSGGVAGVSCTGTPTSSFASANGIVTHC